MTASLQIQKQIYNITKDHNIVQPRGLKVKENLLTDIRFDPTLPFANYQHRQFNFKYFAGELAWYLSKDTNINYINKFSNFWQHITNPGTNEINSNYGALLFGDQLQWVLDSLKADGNTRQAIALLNQPKFQFKDNKDFVCTMYLNFFIRDRKLHMKVQMRSNDIFYGLTFDAPFFALIHQHMYLWLLDTYPLLDLGTYVHCSDNTHFYNRHFELAENILSENIDDNIEYNMKLTQPLFHLHNGHMTLTQLGAKLIAAIDHGVAKDYKIKNYEKILNKYLNVQKI